MERMKNMRILVFGGAGYIGSHTALELFVLVKRWLLQTTY